jgi:hypothetical protein
VSTDHLAEEITELAAHINAATCRWLELIAEFDRREAWAEWGMKSCAHWISWRCALAPGSAREHVRIARRLEALPLIRAAFGRGELSYSKVRALTRVEDVRDERVLLAMAEDATAAQLERIVQAYTGVIRSEDAELVHEERFVSLLQQPDGSWSLRGSLTAEDGALLARALDAARDELRDRDRQTGDGVPAGTSSTSDIGGARNADALGLMAETLLASGPAERAGGDRYQVVVHVDAETIGNDATAGATIIDGSVAPETARRIACDASVIRMTERDGRTISVGRKTRSIPPALRRALLRRDPCCRFPGCTQRRGLDGHHIEHWAHGGKTELDNLAHLCRHHHRLLHEGGFTLERSPKGLVFRTPGGQPLPTVPLPRRGDCGTLRRRSPQIGPATPRPGIGEPFDLGLAVDVVLASAPP